MLRQLQNPSNLVGRVIPNAPRRLKDKHPCLGIRFADGLRPSYQEFLIIRGTCPTEAGAFVSGFRPHSCLGGRRQARRAGTETWRRARQGLKPGGKAPVQIAPARFAARPRFVVARKRNPVPLRTEQLRSCPSERCAGVPKASADGGPILRANRGKKGRIRVSANEIKGLLVFWPARGCRTPLKIFKNFFIYPIDTRTGNMV